MNPRACALILNESEKILLMRRVKNGREYWVFPGGSVELGESAKVAVIREIKEETSLIAEDVNLVFEQLNDGRKESYFSIGHVTGKVKLGDGPEKLKQSEINLYEPQWIEIQKLETINLQPETAARKLKGLLKNGGL